MRSATGGQCRLSWGRRAGSEVNDDVTGHRDTGEAMGAGETSGEIWPITKVFLNGFNAVKRHGCLNVEK